MDSMQEILEQLVASKNELFVRCAIDYREREDFRTPPVVKIEIYTMPHDDETTVVALLYEASHRDHMLRASFGKMGPLSIHEFGSAWSALNFARREWVGESHSLLDLFWQDSPTVACELKPPVGIPVATPMINWLLLAHLMRLQDALQFEIGRQNFRELAYGEAQKGTGDLPQIDRRIGGMIDNLIHRRLVLES